MESNKHAYLIMAHNNFEQLKLLIDVLDHERVDIFIHIDKKSDFRDYDSLKAHAKRSYIDIFSEVSVYWADYSQTECEVALLERAVSHSKHAYYHLISNADFLTMSQEKVLAFFDANAGKEFVAFRFPKNHWPFNNKPYTTEHKYYHFMTKSLRTGNKLVDVSSYCIEYFLVFLQFIFRVDRIKGKYVPCKGSNWWSITQDLADYIISQKEWIEKNFKHTRSSDEVFTSVLVYNSDFDSRLYDRSHLSANNENQRYIDWNRGFPYSFKISDYDEIVASGFPFVRKTNMNTDGGLVKRLHDEILEGRL